MPSVKSPTILGREFSYLLHYVRRRTSRWALALQNKTNVSRQYAVEGTIVSMFAGGFWPHWKQLTILDFLVLAEHRWCGLVRRVVVWLQIVENEPPSFSTTPSLFSTLYHGKSEFEVSAMRSPT